MLHYPNINPIALQLGPIKIRWYGIMYLVGFTLAWFLASCRVKKNQDWTAEQASDLLFYAALGVLIGGRLGYVLFYNLAHTLEHPWSIFAIWRGGMSFHGGLLGVLFSLYLFARHTQKNFWDTTDFVAPLVPLGLAAGRLANFINGELWGRITTAPWGMVFPHVDRFPRHPSQLYECFSEGLLLFVLLWWFSRSPRSRGAVSGVFALGYGVIRFALEFFREPDPQLGFIAWHWLTMGQLLSLPLILIGALLLVNAARTKH